MQYTEQQIKDWKDKAQKWDAALAQKDQSDDGALIDEVTKSVHAADRLYEENPDTKYYWMGALVKCLNQRGLIIVRNVPETQFEDHSGPWGILIEEGGLLNPESGDCSQDYDIAVTNGDIQISFPDADDQFLKRIVRHLNSYKGKINFDSSGYFNLRNEVEQLKVDNEQLKLELKIGGEENVQDLIKWKQLAMKCFQSINAYAATIEDEDLRFQIMSRLLKPFIDIPVSDPVTIISRKALMQWLADFSEWLPFNFRYNPAYETWEHKSDNDNWIRCEAEIPVTDYMDQNPFPFVKMEVTGYIISKPQFQAKITHIDRVYEDAKDGVFKNNWKASLDGLQELRNLYCELLQQCYKHGSE